MVPALDREMNSVGVGSLSVAFSVEPWIKWLWSGKFPCNRVTVWPPLDSPR